MKRSKYFKGIVVTFAVVFALALSLGAISQPISVLAQGSIIDNIQDQSENLGRDKLGLPASNSDPVEFIGKVLTYLLSFLGIIFLLLVLYAGFLWMTAMGDGKKVEKARGIIRTAAIGLAVIVLALAIVQFVLFILRQSVE